MLVSMLTANNKKQTTEWELINNQINDQNKQTCY